MEQEVMKILVHLVMYEQEKKKRRQESAYRKSIKNRNRMGEEEEAEK